MVILAGGKFCENVGKTFHVGVIFDTTPISCIKAYGFWFSRGGYFREEKDIAKNAKNFYVYSIDLHHESNPK